MIDWLEQEVNKQQAKVQESERGLADYRERQNALSLDDKQNIVLSRLNKLNDDVMSSKTKRAQKEVLFNQIRVDHRRSVGRDHSRRLAVRPGPDRKGAGHRRAADSCRARREIW